jgi:predicted RNA-binding Zn-ribbon protein involved in translation (DUF1610 family)
MRTLFQERAAYENRYDHTTVFIARLDMKAFLDFRDKWHEQSPDTEENKFRNTWHLNNIYMMMVGNKLVDRYNERQQAIQTMIAEDEACGARLSAARLASEPMCERCGKTGLRITDKEFMHRDGQEEEGALFFLHCGACDKNTAVWEDGAPWERRHTKCPKCESVMEEKSGRSSKVITTTYTCPNCSHTYEDKLDMNPKDEPEDPDYDEDRRIYCLQDEAILKEHQDARYRFEDLIRFAKENKEKEDNKHIYCAMKEIKKPKIAELTPLLQPVLEKAGYADFSLDKPEMGKHVFVGFSCMDAKSARNDYDSIKTLEKLVKKALANTNWRLTSDGIHYRLGYLNGRIRAYEREEDLKKLVTKDMKLQPKRQANKPDKNDGTLEGLSGEKIIL